MAPSAADEPSAKRRKLAAEARSAIADEKLYDELCSASPTAWINGKVSSSDLVSLPLKVGDLQNAQSRWDRLRPLLAKLFPAEASTGRISSDLEPMNEKLASTLGLGPRTKAFIKCDSHLPVCASVKARGGLFEVFCRAEDVCLQEGLLTKEDNYEKMASPEAREVLRKQEVAVGSTGNLGMSVGLAAASLGMKATIHMSADAKAWKKSLLRSRGVEVVEHAGLYSEAVEQGRRAAEANPCCHFVDDESSQLLFLGYSAAAKELKEQLDASKIEVSKENPLVVYIPCGVGGAPGGICWGLKHTFGDNVHVFFAEPTHAPCVTLGLATGMFDKICVQDIGLDGKTEADGLAVGRCSELVCQNVHTLVAGTYTVDDAELFQNLVRLIDQGGRFMEPSCCAGLAGPKRLAPAIEKTEALKGLLERGTHVFWATGGALVPEAERELFYEKGKRLSETPAM